MFRALRPVFRLTVFLVSGVAARAVPWPAVDSDLPPDPTAHFGTLPNGLRYVILPNSEPKNRVSLRLLVAAGSLHERDDERGLAHFIEHMAFRGTQRHPGDALEKELARLGIGFGPDNTAFTGFNYTVYHLELPDAGEAILQRGLEVFREYASEIAFEPELIDRERGVILSEKATRDTPGARLGAAQLKFLWPTARETKREPIGTVEAVKGFTRSQFVGFYDAWYRPERLAIIVVGNVTVETAEKLIAATFTSLTARAPAREEPADWLATTASRPTVDGFLDAGLVGMEFSLQHAMPDPRAPDTRARRTLAVQRSLALWMLQQRLARLAHTADGTFVSPSASMAVPLPGWIVVAMTVSGRIDTWQRFAAAIEQEHRRAYLHGFTETEVNAARASIRIAYEQNVRSAATRRSEQLAAALEGALLYGQIFVTPQTMLDDIAPALDTATAKECSAAFRELWGAQPPHVFLGSNPALNVQRADIVRVLNKSREMKVEPPSARAAVAFAYAIAGPPGKFVRDETVPDLDVHLAALANGVNVNFKPTAFEADLVTVSVRVGYGQLTQPPGRPGLNVLADRALLTGGLRRHTQDELRELLASHAAQFNFQVQSDACGFYIRCARTELTLCLQLVVAYLNDAAYRPEALNEARADFGSMYANLAASASGPILFKAERILIRDDVRFGYPEHDELFARNLGELSEWLEPQFKTGPIEIAVVGDVAWDEAAAAVAATFGTLPPRAPRADLSAKAAIRFQSPAATPYVFASSPQLAQAAVAWYWPVTDMKDIHDERRARLLVEALTARLRVRLREELGAAYAPAAAFVQREGFPTLGYFNLYAEVATAQVKRAAEVIRSEIEALRARGFSEDDFLRAKTPFVRAREDDLRNNAYWAFTVLDDAQQRPERLAAARDRTADTAAIARAEVNALVRCYLDPARGFMLVAEPGRPQAWGKK